MNAFDFETDPRRADAVDDGGADSDLGLAAAVLDFHQRHVVGAQGDDPADDWDTLEVPREAWEQWLEKARAELGTSAEPPKKYDLALIACSGTKLDVVGSDTRVRAERLYQGQTFKLALQAGRLLAREVRILSAMHEVLAPETLITTYERELPTSKKDLSAWAHRARLRLEQGVLGDMRKHGAFAGGLYPNVLLLLPKAYASVQHAGGTWSAETKSWAGWNVTWPFKGLGIGEQKAWLKKALAGEVTP